MSDCSTNAWRVPAEREPGVIYQHGMYDAAMIEHVSAIEVEGVRFERVQTCAVVAFIKDVLPEEPNSVELSCGHTFDFFEDKPPNYCQECGAKVVS